MEKEKVLNAEEVNELVEKAKQEDKKALAILIEYFYRKIYINIYYRVNNEEDAEDLTQTVFIKMVKSLRNQNGNFAAWLYKIASNLVIDFYRHRSYKNEVPLDEQIQIPASAPAEDFPEEALTEEQFKKALAGLTEEQKKVVILKFIQGYKNEEIARALDKSVGAVKGLQFRAIGTLKGLLKGKT